MSQPTCERHPVRRPGQVLPNELLPQRLPFFGGYRLAMVLVSVAWALGLVGIATWMIRRRRLEVASLVDWPPVVSLAERLRLIIEDAVAGKLSQTRLAESERTQLAFWRHLDLEGLKASEAIARLRQHSEAGEMLRQLEAGLPVPEQVATSTWPRCTVLTGIYPPNRSRPNCPAPLRRLERRGPLNPAGLGGFRSGIPSVVGCDAAIEDPNKRASGPSTISLKFCRLPTISCCKKPKNISTNATEQHFCLTTQLLFVQLNNKTSVHLRIRGVLMSDSYTGSPLDPDDLWFRDDFNRWMWELLRSEHVLLTAPRRTGKTSVMDHMAARPQGAYSAVSVLVQDLDHPGEFLLTLLDAFHE